MATASRAGETDTATRNPIISPLASMANGLASMANGPLTLEINILYWKYGGQNEEETLDKR
jgi:hypothetical protein